MPKHIALLPHQIRYFTKPSYWQYATMLTRIVDVGKNINISHLRQAAEITVANHSAFNLRFTQTSTEWSQYLSEKSNKTKIELIDFTAISKFNLPNNLSYYIEKQRINFDLKNGPLINFSLITTKKTNLLLVCAHHLCIDGKSWQIIMRELWSTYSMIDKGKVISKTPEKTSFDDYVKFVLNTDSVNIQKQMDYWGNVLKNSKNNTIEIPVDKTPNKNQLNKNKIREYRLRIDDGDFYYSLEHTAKILAIHPQAIAIGALSKTLYEWTKSSNLSIDFRSRARRCFKNHIDLSNAVGWCNTTYPINMQLLPNLEANNLQHLNKLLLETEDNSYGYELLMHYQQNKDPIKYTNEDSRPKISFNFHGNFDEILPSDSSFRLLSGPSTDYLTEQAIRTHLIDISIYALNRKTIFIWRYDERYHSIKTIEKLAKHFCNSILTIINTGEDL
ncbi:MAG: hypothetical protein KAT71_07280, partial [Gammaproteobacteria bacterium]|nr:hypothetical protein [Gammaproteobacteria bacterium]